MKPILIFLFCFNIGSAIAQDQMTYESEKGKLYTRLTARNISSSYTSEIERFYNHTCDSLINADLKIDDESIKSTLTKLFQASNIELDKRTISILRIPSLNANFLEVVEAYKKTPLVVPFRLLGINRTRILAAAFKGTPAGDTIRSYVELREMMYSPVLIPGRISKSQFASYRDTMLHYLASMEPELYLTELKTNNILQELTNNTNHKTVKAIASLQDDANLVEMLPFGLAIAEQRTTTDAVRKLINKPSAYYSAFTKEMLELNNSDQQDRRDFLRSYNEDLNHVLCEHYVNPINELHEKPDNVRYQILNNISSDPRQ